MITGDSMTLEELYYSIKKELANLGNNTEINQSEVYLLINKVMGISREELIRDFKKKAPYEEVKKVRELLAQRISGVPLQYILGEWEFFGLPFKVGPGVLIPRPETEELVDVAISVLSEIEDGFLLDLCSGTGCIPIAITHQLPGISAYGIELSERAYRYFRENIALNQAHSVHPILGDALAIQDIVFPTKFDVITSNPPYIESREIAYLQKEVQHEPTMALDGGSDGLIFYRSFSEHCKKLLKPDGWLLFEIGNEQGDPVKEILISSGYRNVQVKKDLFGNDRIVMGKSSI